MSYYEPSEPERKTIKGIIIMIVSSILIWILIMIALFQIASCDKITT